jgi:hypothetical protein
LGFSTQIRINIAYRGVYIPNMIRPNLDLYPSDFSVFHSVDGPWSIIISS